MKRELIFIFIFLFSIQFLCAADTVIKISTLSNHDLRLTFINPDASTDGGNIIIETKRVNSGESGEISVPFSTSEKTFNLNYAVIFNGSTILSSTVKDIISGENLHMLLIPGAVEITKNYVEPEVIVPLEEVIVQNETKNETIATNESATISGNAVSNETQSSNETKKDSFWSFLKLFRISGFVSSGEEKSSNNFLYYGILAIMIVAVFFFFFSRGKKKKIDGTHEMQFRNFRNDTDELQDAEKKIVEAASEIRDLKSRKEGYNSFGSL